MPEKEKPNAVCGDCTGLMLVGGANQYQCAHKGIILDRKVVDECIRIVCDKFDEAPRMLRVSMREFVEVGITKVYGDGSIQLPIDIRKQLKIKDGDKILWIRKGRNEYTFRKVGFEGKPEFSPHYT